ncbi:acriflavin resistance protein [Terasakiispira papahanaumokuakeensis]|uniref:Acriflavin resistance protein n=1 Tax=Terasakiispira papahanaumokuakeensis TaxID=197479 RepID=A0A1E2VDL6_9GAMM|nr:efflux RND transporter permease subunit [Terasakiispira papahanaumokuakeensis]ODC05054.1 acriflavin resistance protein [Terasakiispira papahanaumokuakeensis]
MESLIRAAMLRSRAALLLLTIIVAGGLGAYISLPKEANPDVTVPWIYISMTLEGISPEDAERLLVRPMEQELRALEGVKEMKAIAGEGHASVTLEFDAGFNPDKALQDVRDKVDTARTELPDEADDPQVHEINVAQFPVLSVALSGPLSQAALVATARQLQDAIESIPEVLEVDIGGDREDLMEIVVDPQVLQSYGLDYDQLYQLVNNNNRLVAAGSLDSGAGRLPLKVPGLIESLDDVLNIPVKVNGDTVVTFKDIATVHRTFKDPTGFARINGQPGLVLEVSKRAGANIIETIDQVKALIEASSPQWPEGLKVRYIMDQSHEIRDLLSDLLNNVLTAVVLVMIILLATMGARSAFLAGLTIPGAFLAGILMIWALGFTLNIIVLFALILVAGMLVDGAIVVTELADRHRQQGLSPFEAWAQAASRMGWPVTASTATTIAVFLPLLFWPGVTGEFMKYLPATVIVCLLASLLMALVFLPVMGQALGNQHPPKATSPHPWARGYRHLLTYLLRHPGTTLLAMLALTAIIYMAYKRLNYGTEFFPDTEPESAQLIVHARGDLSIYESDALLQQIEQRLYPMSEVKSFYARSYSQGNRDEGEDVIGEIKFQLVDWYQRRPANQILQDMRQRTADVAGVQLDFRKPDNGPSSGKPIQIRISGQDTESMSRAVDQLRKSMETLGGFIDIEDNRNIAGIEWRLAVDREAAARFGADINSVGSAIQLVSNGLLLATYRPADADDEVDIRVRVPPRHRTLDQLDRMTLQTSRGEVPIRNFVTLKPAPRVGSIHHVNGDRTFTLKADVAPGYQVQNQLQRLLAEDPELPKGVQLSLAGQDEDQKESVIFLSTAFIIALLLMAWVLTLQFNSFYQTLLVLSAIVFSTAGVLLGLLINQQPFGVVMVGMGIIALGGIVVNNNIVLIDTYNQFRQAGSTAFEAALETGCLRLRPVLLTAITTVLGLMPMVLSMNIDLLSPMIGWGAPSTQWWTQLSSAIAGGLAFATGLTLLVTPCMLLLGAQCHHRWQQWDQNRHQNRDQHGH